MLSALSDSRSAVLMLVFLSVLLVVLGVLLNRLCNRYFRRYGEQFADDPAERMFLDSLWVAFRRYPPVVMAFLGYFLGIYLVIYGLLILVT